MLTEPTSYEILYTPQQDVSGISFYGVSEDETQTEIETKVTLAMLLEIKDKLGW